MERPTDLSSVGSRLENLKLHSLIRTVSPSFTIDLMNPQRRIAGPRVSA